MISELLQRIERQVEEGAEPINVTGLEVRTLMRTFGITGWDFDPVHGEGGISHFNISHRNARALLQVAAKKIAEQLTGSTK